MGTYDGYAEMNELAWERKVQEREETRIKVDPMGEVYRLKRQEDYLSAENTKLSRANSELSQDYAYLRKQFDDFKVKAEKEGQALKEIQTKNSLLEKRLADCTVELQMSKGAIAELRNLISITSRPPGGL